MHGHIEQTDSCREVEEQMEEGEGISQGTCMHDPWQQIIVW